MTPAARALRALLAADAIVLLSNPRALVIGLVVPLLLLVVIDRSGGHLGDADFYGAVAIVITIGLMTTALTGYAPNIARDRERGVLVAIFDSASHQSAWDAQAWLRLLACLGYIAVGSVVGIRWFRWDAR